MKRLMVMFGMIVLVGLPNLAKGQARGIGGIGPVHYRSGSYGYVDRGGYGYYGGDWYGGRVGPCGDNEATIYGPGSISDLLFGWRADRALKMQEKEQDWRHQQEEVKASSEQNKILFENASQRARMQKMEDENQKLKKKIAELEKKIDQLLAAKSGK